MFKDESQVNNQITAQCPNRLQQNLISFITITIAENPSKIKLKNKTELRKSTNCYIQSIKYGNQIPRGVRNGIAN